MLDLNVLLAKQSEGDHLLANLEPKEMLILQNFGILAVQGLMKTGRLLNQPTNNIILNAFRNGISRAGPRDPLGRGSGKE